MAAAAAATTRRDRSAGTEGPLHASLSPLHFPPVPPPHAHRKRLYWTTVLAVLLAFFGWAVLEWADPAGLLSDLHGGTPAAGHAHLRKVSAILFSETPTKLSTSVLHDGGPADTDNTQGTASATATESVTSFYAEAGNFRCPQPQRYTKAEVARHATEDDLWIVVDGNVLDVSGFVTQHPGGAVLLDGAGGHEMATVFARFHDPTSVQVFASFCIGQLRR